MKIVLDPGHGGHDSGARNPNLLLRESDLVLSYAIMLKTFLKDAGHEVLLTRDEDIFPSLSDRVRLANDENADLFLSLHCNAPLDPKDYQRAEGIEVWTYFGETESDVCATLLYREIEKAFFSRRMRQDQKDGDPDKEGNLFVLHYTKMPAVLIELGFITNDMEANWLRDYGVQRKYCRAITNGLRRWQERE